MTCNDTPRTCRAPLSYFQTHRTGDLMSRATNDLNAVRMMIGPAVIRVDTVLGFALPRPDDRHRARLALPALIPLPFVDLGELLGGVILSGSADPAQLPR